MNRNLTLILLLVLGLAVAFLGCDSDGDDTPDDERIVGMWEASAARVNTTVPGVSIPILDAGNADQVTLVFGTDGRYTLTLEDSLEISVSQVGETITIPGGSRSGTYELVANEQIRFTTDGLTGSIAIDHDFQGSDRLDLSVDNTDEGQQVIALILGLEADNPILALVAGGSLSLRRVDQP